MAASELRRPTCQILRLGLYSETGHSAGYGRQPGLSLGHGFLCLAGLLAEDVIHVYRNLCWVDHLLESSTTAPPAALAISQLLYLRNTAVHEVLFLPTHASQLSRFRVELNEVVYEVCRLTATLYSNAIMLGLPLYAEWRLLVLERLHRIFQVVGSIPQLDGLTSLWIWSLLLASIAARHTSHSTFFESALRDLLSYHHTSGWTSVKLELSSFLWSNRACEHGATALWQAMGLP
jgi:hypothetical protein